MTETLLQRLEEKMMALFSELEDARKEITKLHHENANLHAEREKHTKKLHDLLSLLDAVNITENITAPINAQVAVKPMLVQG